MTDLGWSVDVSCLPPQDRPSVAGPSRGLGRGGGCRHLIFLQMGPAQFISYVPMLSPSQKVGSVLGPWSRVRQGRALGLVWVAPGAFSESLVVLWRSLGAGGMGGPVALPQLNSQVLVPPEPRGFVKLHLLWPQGTLGAQTASPGGHTGLAWPGRCLEMGLT